MHQSATMVTISTDSVGILLLEAGDLLHKGTDR